MRIDKFDFQSVCPDKFGKWCLYYYRRETLCSRPIVDASEKTIHWRTRRPIGAELENTAQEVIGRKLSRDETDELYRIEVVSTACPVLK